MESHCIALAVLELFVDQGGSSLQKCTGIKGVHHCAALYCCYNLFLRQLRTGAQADVDSLCSLGWLQTYSFLFQPPKCGDNRQELPGPAGPLVRSWRSLSEIGSEESGNLWPVDQSFYRDEMNRKHGTRRRGCGNPVVFGGGSAQQGSFS